MVAAYLIDPARRTYELDELAADEGIAIAGAAEDEAPTTASSRSTARRPAPTRRATPGSPGSWRRCSGRR